MSTHFREVVERYVDRELRTERVSGVDHLSDEEVRVELRSDEELIAAFAQDREISTAFAQDPSAAVSQIRTWIYELESAFEEEKGKLALNIDIRRLDRLDRLLYRSLMVWDFKSAVLDNRRTDGVDVRELQELRDRYRGARSPFVWALIERSSMFALLADVDSYKLMADALYFLRLKAGFTQEQLHERILQEGDAPGVAALRHYEHGRRKPTLDDIDAWAHACGYTFEWSFSPSLPGRIIDAADEAEVRATIAARLVWAERRKLRDEAFVIPTETLRNMVRVMTHVEVDLSEIPTGRLLAEIQRRIDKS